MRRAHVGLVILVGLLACCRSVQPMQTLDDIPPELVVDTPPPQHSITTPEELKAFATESQKGAPTFDEYLIGPNDQIHLDLWDDERITGGYVVGPDGRIGIPLIGDMRVAGLTRNEAASRIKKKLEPYYPEANVTVDVRVYRNNIVYVLGRVEKPGYVEFNGRGNILQALALAGGIPVHEASAFLTRCSIIRGRNEIVWIDLLKLLQGGDLSLNVPLQNGDIVFIPEPDDQQVFVMGWVETPGAVEIRSGLRLMDALAKAKGPTSEADLSSIYLVRDPGKGKKSPPIRVNVRRMIETGDFRQNYDLRVGDVIYVPRSGASRFQYALSTISPALGFATFGIGLGGSD